ncbi:MAG: exonuclease domain-containing protein [Coxiellaceae bacterium]|nr:exonuclease domain-containing protein [Coxiellaceae bacterium]
MRHLLRKGFSKMPKIILDSETTGFSPQKGHRIVQIACIEIYDGNPVNRFNTYLNPGRDSDPAALRVHGLTSEYLADKPKFADVADEFLAFINDAELVIHNAPFDVSFLNRELSLIKKPLIENVCKKITDTRIMSKTLFTNDFLTRELVTKKLIEDEFLVQECRAKLGDDNEMLISALSKNQKFRIHSLDHLCKYYKINLLSRAEYHGAMVDCELLAQVYTHLEREGRKRMMLPSSSPAHAGLFQSRQSPQTKSTAPSKLAHP